MQKTKIQITHKGEMNKCDISFVIVIQFAVTKVACKCALLQSGLSLRIQGYVKTRGMKR